MAIKFAKKNKEQETRNKEQRTKNKEQRTTPKYPHIFDLISSNIIIFAAIQMTNYEH